jgi:glycosyltransferase involved in cell wall biosynthesis
MSLKKKIVVANIIDSSRTGGSEIYSINLANALAETEEVESHLIITRIEETAQERVNKNVNYFFLGKKNLLDFAAIGRLFKYIKKHKIQIIHAHSTSYFYPVLLKYITGIKIVWHDHYGETINPNGKRDYPYIGFSRFFDYVICVSKQVLENNRKHLKLSEEKINYLPNFSVLQSTDNELVSFDKTKINLVMLGVVRPQKDYENILQALHIVKQQYENIMFYALGLIPKDAYDDYIKKVFELVNTLGLENCVKFCDEVRNPSDYLKQAQIAILSSVSEGLPLSVIEYGLQGIPTVCTNVGECASLLGNGDYGWLVPAQNSKAMADAILEVINNKQIAGEKAEKFKAFTNANFSKKAVVGKIVGLYNKIIA